LCLFTCVTEEACCEASSCSSQQKKLQKNLHISRESLIVQKWAWRRITANINTVSRDRWLWFIQVMLTVLQLYVVTTGPKRFFVEACLCDCAFKSRQRVSCQGCRTLRWLMMRMKDRGSRQTTFKNPSLCWFTCIGFIRACFSSKKHVNMSLNCA